MPTLPTEQQLEAVERRWQNLLKLAANPTVEAGQAANVAEASARDVTPLLAWVRAMQPGYALLGHCRRLLDQIADGRTGLAASQVAAGDLAQRITDEIGHPRPGPTCRCSGEPPLGPDLRAENAALAAKIQRLQAATIAALRRGDEACNQLAAALAKPNTSGCACQDATPCPEPAEGSEDILIAALTRNAATATRHQLTDQITAWVMPCHRAGLAARLATELVAARQDPAPQGPCNPMIVFDGDDVLLVCAVDGTTIIDLVLTRRWSALVSAVALHRCKTTATTPSESEEANGAADRT
jgi:hypothetical protein